MARSELGEGLRDARRSREAAMTPEQRSVRAQQLAEQGVRDFARTRGLTYGEARRRLKVAAHAGRTPTKLFDDV